MPLYPDDEIENLDGSTATDDLFQQGDDIFAVPLVRLEGHLDEMTDGMLIDPKFLPPIAPPVGSIVGSMPIIVTPDGTTSWVISIDLTDFILRSNPVVPATPAAGDCSLLIASTEYVCDAIADACQVFGPHPTIAGAYNFEDCDGNAFTLQTYPNPTFVEAPANVFTWNDAVTNETRVLDLRPNTFTYNPTTAIHTWTNPVTGLSNTINMNASAIVVDPTTISCVASTNLQGALQDLCTVIEGLEDRFLTVAVQTGNKTGSVLVTDSVANETYELMQSCDFQRTTDIVPTGSMVIICTPNDGSFKTNLLDLIPDPIVPVIPDFPVEFCTGIGIDLDTDQVSGNCEAVYTKYCFSVDLCKFPQIFKSEPNPLGTPPILPLDDATTVYFPICVDGDSVKLSLEDAKECFKEEVFFIDGIGTSLSGTGTELNPWKNDLAACELGEDLYTPSATLVVCSGTASRRMPSIKAGNNVTIQSDGTLDVADVVIPPAAPSGVLILDTPITIEDQYIQTNNGDVTYNSGVITLDLSTLPGVTIPAASTAAIIRCAVGTNGQEVVPPDDSWLFSHASIELAKTAAGINGSNPNQSGEFPSLVAYVDTNLLKADNDMTGDFTVKMDVTSVSYKMLLRFNVSEGIQGLVGSMRLVGFI